MTSFPGPAFPARARRLAALERLLTERILVLDGAMGTMIQRHKLTEADFRGVIDFIAERTRRRQSLLFGAYQGAVNRTQTYLVMSHDDGNGRIADEGGRYAAEFLVHMRGGSG